MDGMQDPMTLTERPRDGVFLTAIVAAAVLLPSEAMAAEVGCFVTAVLLGMMFTAGIILTSVVKHLLARYVWRSRRTPWLRLFGLTWLELVLGIAVFAAIRTSYWLTVVIYLPFAALLNGALLARVRPSGPERVPILKRYGIFLLFPIALPFSIQIAGVVWNAVTNFISFADLKM
jgi:hypothetical protein